MTEVRRVIDWMDHRRVSFDITEGLIGGAAIDAAGGPLPDNTLDAAKNSTRSDGRRWRPKWETMPFQVQPERGLLGIAENSAFLLTCVLRWFLMLSRARRPSRKRWSAAST